MKVIIENMFFGWHENAPETFIKLINSLVVVKDETEVRNVMQHFAQSSIFNTIFAYGFGAHHLWVAQRMITDPEKVMENRLLIVEF